MRASWFERLKAAGAVDVIDILVLLGAGHRPSRGPYQEARLRVPLPLRWSRTHKRSSDQGRCRRAYPHHQDVRVHEVVPTVKKCGPAADCVVGSAADYGCPGGVGEVPGARRGSVGVFG